MHAPAQPSAPSTGASASPAPAAGGGWHSRLHRALLPDYNRKAAVFWWTVVLAGAAVLMHSAAALASESPWVWAQVAMGAMIAALAALFPVRIPRSKNSLAAGEIFVFLLLLLQGTAAASIAAAAEAAIGSIRTSKRWSSRIASPMMAAVAMFGSGSLLHGLLGLLRARELADGALLIVAAMLFAMMYFVCNTVLVTAVPRLKRNERLQLGDLVGIFGWLGIVYAGSAAVAALLYLAFRQSGMGVLMAVLPIIGLLLATLHYFFRQQEANEAVRRASEDASAREAEAAARHVQELHHIAFHDALTGLPNRRNFNERLAEAIERAKDGESNPFALLFIDLDRFKLINDSLGHEAGDEFLVQVARRIQQSLRSTDFFARLGGDEFAILVRELERTEVAEVLAERLLKALDNPVVVAGADLTVSASVGITFSSMGYASPDEALRDADIAMYKAKEAGKARYALFDASLHAELATRLRLEGALRNAVANGELSLAYQPMYELDTGELIGFEALARWNHPRYGVVAPNVFIPIAEESGLILKITDFVLHHACHQLKTWQQKDPALANLQMHVNISGKDIAQDALVSRVSQALRLTRIQPQHLTLELTENILAERIERSLPMLAELRTLGVQLSVDDFGTGYSSLAHLSNLPIDSLKVDRSFVRELTPGSKEAKVARAIVQLGTSLDRSVVAEGIETAAQLAQLREMGCARGQGFHLGRPQAPEAIDALLEELVSTAAYAARRAEHERYALLH